MNELPVNIFQELDRDKELMFQIKNKLSYLDKIKASMMFNYYYYSSVYNFSEGSNKYKDAIQVLKFFILKEDNLLNQIPYLNNTYQIAIMMNSEELLQLLIGKNSNIISIKTDASKVGLLLAFIYKKFNITRTEMLSETLFFAESML